MLRIAVYSLSSCQGCITNILTYMGEFLEKLGTEVDIMYFKLVKEPEEEVIPYVHLAFVEGSVTLEEQVEFLKLIRRRSGTLVALGTCASTGGVAYYSSRSIDVKSIPVEPAYTQAKALSEIVYVDYELRGCPVLATEFMEFITKFIRGGVWRPPDYHVCAECKLAGLDCLLDEGKPCLGPITMGGCKAICRKKGLPCYGCRGPALEVDVKAFLKSLEKRGVNVDDVKKMVKIFMGRRGGELL